MPSEFSTLVLRELDSRDRNLPWVRGAAEICRMYAEVDLDRFDWILGFLSRGPEGSAMGEGARWLRTYWQSQLASVAPVPIAERVVTRRMRP
jgi:hypothetical protein